MSDPLTHLSNKYGCDKSDRNHRYTQWYYKILLKRRPLEFNLLEFGFGQGKSVKMWADFLPKAKIVNVDIRDQLPRDRFLERLIEDDRFEFFSSDQIDISSKSSLFKKYKSFFMIIDDASHVPEDQQYTMGVCFQFVEPGGWYVIEDLKCKRNHSLRFAKTAKKTLEVLNRYLDQGVFYSNILTKEQNYYISQNIAKVEIHDKIAFIRKKR